MNDRPVIAVDTSVAIPLVFADHEQHAMVAAWAAGKRLALSGHALAETYSVLTRLPAESRIMPDDVVRLLDENFEEPFVASANTTTTLHRVLAAKRVAGGAVYDALVALAAIDNDAVLATRDARARGTYEAVGVTTELVTG